MKALVDGVSLPEALRALAGPIYCSANPEERDRYGDRIVFSLTGLRVGGYVAVWMVCDNPEVDASYKVERFVPCGALDAAIHRLWHDYDCESMGLAPPSLPPDAAARLPDRVAEVAALLGRYDRPTGRKPAPPRPTDVFSRICTTTRDAQAPWWGWDGATLFLCRVGTKHGGESHGGPRYDENLVALLSALGIPVERLDPHPDARGDDFLAVLQASAALRERDQARREIERRWDWIRRRENEIAGFAQEIARFEERLRESELPRGGPADTHL